MKFIITFFIACTCFMMNGQDGLDSAFAKANEAYTAQKYEIAIAGYNQILKSDKHSAEVYFNLANAYYKLNDIAPAIYNYEKALQLDPANTDALTNLGYANKMKLDAIEELPKDSLKERFSTFAQGTSVDTWAYLSIVILLFTTLFFILYFYAATTGKKRLFFLLGLLGIIATIFTIITAFAAQSAARDTVYAIIFDNEVTTRNEPRDNADSTFTLHEGTKVQVLETLKDWAQVQLANGSKSWIPVSSFKTL